MKAGVLGALLLMTSFLTGCSSNPTCEPLVDYQVKEITKDRYVALGDSLTRTEPLVSLPEDMRERSPEDRLIAIGVAYKAQRVRAAACYGQLSEIQRLQEGLPEAGSSVEN